MSLKASFGGMTDPLTSEAADMGAGPGGLGMGSRATSGFAGGALIATGRGWRPVESIAPGDQVLTFDRDLQPVRAVRRGHLWCGARPCPAPLRPLCAPVGTLGNAAPLTLLPEQNVLVESDMAERLYGDPFVLLPARLLAGARGIGRVLPAAPIEVIALHFERDEIVFANGGALVFCPARGEGDTVPLDRLDAPETAEAGYVVPTPAEAQRLVAALGDGAVQTYAA